MSTLIRVEVAAASIDSRKRLRFEILKTTVIALCGDRGARLRSANTVVNVGELDLNLEPFG